MTILLISSLSLSLGTGHYKRTFKFIKYLSEAKSFNQIIHIVINYDNLSLSLGNSYSKVNLINCKDKQKFFEIINDLKNKVKNIFIDIGAPSLDIEEIFTQNKYLNSKITVIDDLNEYKHIKQAYIISQDVFYALKEENIFTGLSYALISPIEFPVIRKSLETISIFLGGTDVLNICNELYPQLEIYAEKKHININFIYSKNSKHILNFTSNSNFLKIFCDLENLDKIIKNSDFFITTPGMSALESISNWCPVGLIQTNKNQDQIIDFLLKKKCCLLIDRSYGLNTVESLINFKIPSSEQIYDLSKQCSKLCLNKGFKKTSALYLRK